LEINPRKKLVKKVDEKLLEEVKKDSYDHFPEYDDRTGVYQLPSKVPFFYTKSPKLPRAKCTSCSHMLIYTQLQYITRKIGEVNIQTINKIIYKNNVK
jgi:hypothetical protein